MRWAWVDLPHILQTAIVVIGLYRVYTYDSPEQELLLSVRIKGIEYVDMQTCSDGSACEADRIQLQFQLQLESQKKVEKSHH